MNKNLRNSSKKQAKKIDFYSFFVRVGKPSAFKKFSKSTFV